ncbi:MAG: DUF4494 domain-containing protein [Porphyromonadaceae bacterium]|nr:DUF4494 domain-containing protein [Porphyromonadaceae bacterium]
MYNWFQCKVKYERNGEDGAITKVNEAYLIDALSFTEAEERINEEMKPYISGEFMVADIKRARISELFVNESGDKWYRCKVNFITLDEEKGIEKRVASTMYAQASTLKEAVDVIEKGMKDSLSDYEIASVMETNVMDVFRYKSE